VVSAKASRSGPIVQPNTTGRRPFVKRADHLRRGRSEWPGAGPQRDGVGTSLDGKEDGMQDPRTPDAGGAAHLVGTSGTITRATRIPSGAGSPSVALLLRLHDAGVSEEGLERLLLLRAAYRRRPPALDGFTPDERLRFARWLYEHGRLLA
jgi:hypothetical protein